MKISISKLLSMAALAAIFILPACDQMGGDSYETTDTGLQYKYIKEGEGASPKTGEILLINMTYQTEDDSLLMSTEKLGGPVPIKIDSSAQGQIYEGFSMLKKGDSVLFKISAEEVFMKTFNAPIPDFIDSASYITFNIGVEDVMSEQDFQAYQMERMREEQESMMAEQGEQMQTDSTKIEEFLKENNIEAQATESGLRYVIEEEGSGVQPSPGDSVYVHYTGKLLDGTEFDSSRGRGEPLAFPIGQGWVIPGWDEGISLLKKGGKSTLYIPSPLAYGPEARGDIIKENSILVFDVELVDVKQVSN